MTTPVTVSQATSSRRQNIPAAAGHRRRARRSPGRSPGTTDFASRPGFPHDLGWGPLCNYARGRGAALVVHPGRSRSVSALANAHGSSTRVVSGARRITVPAFGPPRTRRRGPAFCGCSRRRSRRPDARRIRRRAPIPRSYPAQTNRGRSCAVTGPGRGRSTFLGVGSPTRADRRSDARAPVRAAPRRRPRRRRRGPVVAGAQLL